MTKRLLVLFLSFALALSVAAQGGAASSAVLERNVRAHLEFLASDALQGRGSGTRDELLAGMYIAAQLRQFGIEPAGDNGGYIQTVNVGARQSFAAPPQVSFKNGDKTVVWTHGKETIVWRLSAGPVSGPLQKLSGDAKVQAGAVVLATFPEGQTQREYQQAVFGLVRQGAAAVLSPETAETRKNWDTMAAALPTFTNTAEEFRRPGGGAGPGSFNLVFLSKEAAQTLQSVPDGTPVSIGGALGPEEKRQTWNVVGVLPGSGPSADAILLSAHMDHLGLRAGAPGDNIFNGADDDASGCVAVLELARALGAGAKLRRTVYFVAFGSEEAGGFGAQYFLKHPPLPLEKIAANLQFEMIGRPDAKVKPEELWLTGYERSNLGPELAKQGAKIVQDPHPEQNFFQRSDNYPLARMGIVAHTVSSFGLHQEYHQPNDDLAHIDFKHITYAINSMVEPVRRLANSDFKPTWVEGKKP
jgi:hypothetical protein